MAFSLSPSSSSFKEASNIGRAIRFVYCDDDENGKFKINPDAIDVLRLITGPIAVVSVCGPAHHGKSFLLNQLLGRSAGFRVASNHRPGTKGLWIWSAPLKKTALDGTTYNLILLDSEGFDTCNQTEAHSSWIFALTVLLSSLFVYNQIGVIDEGAFDHLSLVTEITKHIRVRASEENDTVFELGQFSPVFVWLSRDICLELTKHAKITPREYLELALRPVQGCEQDVVTKNMIRESIRVLFPHREWFTLVRPLINETDLQHLDQVSPEFQSGLDALSKFVYETTRPKQVGGTIMTGPILAGITKSFLDTVNNGVVPTISVLWQNVEESECQRAFDMATEVYMIAFDNAKPLEEVSLRAAHDKAVQRSIVAFNASAIGAGLIRQKYEGKLQNFFVKAVEDYKRNAFMEAELQCSNAIHSMEKKLQAACLVDNANFHHIVMFLDNLLSEYEASVNGPTKWQKLASFLRQSLQGPVIHYAQKLTDEILSKKSSFMLKCRSIEDNMELLNKQLEASEKFKTEYKKLYEDAINDLKKLSDHYKSRIVDLDSKCSLLEERCSSLLEMLDSAKQESLEWKRIYEETLTKKRKFNDQADAKTTVFKSESCNAEARVAASNLKAELAEKEANKWKEKYDVAVKETMAAMEKAASMQECSTEQEKLREEALCAKFSKILAEKEEEIKDKLAKLVDAEQRLQVLTSDLKAAETKIQNYNFESSTMKSQIKELTEKYEFFKASTQSLEREAQMLLQDKTQLEHKYLVELRGFEEATQKCKISEQDVQLANGFVKTARSQLLTTQNELSNAQQLAEERFAQTENAFKQIDILERQKVELACEVERSRALEHYAVSKASLLEAVVKEKDQEIESLKLQWEQRVSLFQAFDGSLEADLLEENGTAEAESLQEKINLLEQELNSDHLNESLRGAALKSFTPGKRSRLEVSSTSMDSIQDMDIDGEIAMEMKKPKTPMTLQKCMTTEVDHSVLKGIEGNSVSLNASSADYAKFTVKKLREELTINGFGAELLELKSPRKKEILDLYKKLVLKNSNI